MMLTEFIQNTFVEAYADSDGEHQEIEEPLGMRGQRIQESGRGRDCSAENPEDQCAERQKHHRIVPALFGRILTRRIRLPDIFFGFSHKMAGQKINEYDGEDRRNQKEQKTLDPQLPQLWKEILLLSQSDSHGKNQKQRTQELNLFIQFFLLAGKKRPAPIPKSMIISVVIVVSQLFMQKIYPLVLAKKTPSDQSEKTERAAPTVDF